MGQEERRWLIMELSDLRDSRLQRFVLVKVMSSIIMKLSDLRDSRLQVFVLG